MIVIVIFVLCYKASFRNNFVSMFVGRGLIDLTFMIFQILEFIMIQMNPSHMKHLESTTLIFVPYKIQCLELPLRMQVVDSYYVKVRCWYYIAFENYLFIWGFLIHLMVFWGVSVHFGFYSDQKSNTFDVFNSFSIALDVLPH